MEEAGCDFVHLTCPTGWSGRLLADRSQDQERWRKKEMVT